MTWDYDRIEIIADGIIHATGISLGLVGAIAIIIVAVDLPRIEITSIVIYILGLVAMLVISGAYNMWPISPTKWILRRFDHSAIYLLIAGTYMAFLAQMKSSVVAVGLGIGVWASAVIGVVLKLALPGRFDRIAVVLCLLFGWGGAAAYDSIASDLPNAALWLLLIGGALYSVWNPVSRLAAPALSQRDLAQFCLGCGKLPLFGGAHLLGTVLRQCPIGHPAGCH